MENLERRHRFLAVPSSDSCPPPLSVLAARLVIQGTELFEKVRTAKLLVVGAGGIGKFRFLSSGQGM